MRRFFPHQRLRLICLTHWLTRKAWRAQASASVAPSPKLSRLGSAFTNLPAALPGHSPSPTPRLIRTYIVVEIYCWGDISAESRVYFRQLIKEDQFQAI